VPLQRCAFLVWQCAAAMLCFFGLAMCRCCAFLVWQCAAQVMQLNLSQDVISHGLLGDIKGEILLKQNNQRRNIYRKIEGEIFIKTK